MNVVLTKSTMPIVKYVAIIMGYLMDGIYIVLDKIGIPNVGLSIILFTLIVYLLMMPLQIRQQKFSKMNTIMAPELNKIRDKYKDKKDQASMEKMNAETQAVYAKYGVSPTGSCVQLIIQMPILFALYQVIYKIPGYIGNIKSIFDGLVAQITSISGYTQIIENFVSENKISTLQLTYENEIVTNNSIVDFLYKLSPSQWENLANVSEFSGMKDVIASTSKSIASVNNFFGMNISDNPLSLITSSFKSGSWLLLIAAVLIPVLAWFTQFLNTKLIPQPAVSEGDTMSASMKSMNTLMPLMSAFFCLTLPVGVGIYWICGAVIRAAQTFFINKKLDKMDMDEMVKKNMEAAAKKEEKKKEVSAQLVNANATKKTRTISSKATGTNSKNVQKSASSSGVNYSNAKEGSIAKKASMVYDFDEKNRKK